MEQKPKFDACPKDYLVAETGFDSMLKQINLSDAKTLNGMAASSRESEIFWLRELAWHGQHVTGREWYDTRTSAPVCWLRFLLNQWETTNFEDRLSSDRRLYKNEQILLDGDFANVLTWLDRSKITKREFEIALTLFDWWCDRPRFAPWVYYRPNQLRNVFRLLLRSYTFPLINGFREAQRWRHNGKHAFPEKDELGNQRTFAFEEREGKTKEQDLTGFRYAPGAIFGAEIRMTGLITVGYLACCGIDALQHTIWNSTYYANIMIVLASLLGAVWLLALDVQKKTSGQLRKREVYRRTGGTIVRLWIVGFVVVASCNLLMYTTFPTILGDQWVSNHASAESNFYNHPVSIFPLGLKDWLHFLVSTITVTFTATLLGIVVQWLWDESSAIESI